MFINKNISNAIELASKEAYKSRLCHKHGAVIIKNGKIVGKGFNFSYTEKYHGNWSMHAENAAIIDCISKGIKVSGTIMIVVRLYKNRLLNSEPCKNCKQKIKNYGISKIFYS